jgi:hypothetical protein
VEGVRRKSVSRQTPPKREQSSRDRLEDILELLADEVAERLVQRGTLLLADESPRRREEVESWRDEERGTESSAPIKNETSGESSSLKKEVRELVSFFATEGEARAAKRIAQRDLERIAGITVKEAMEKYEMHQREEKRQAAVGTLDTDATAWACCSPDEAALCQPDACSVWRLSMI